MAVAGPPLQTPTAANVTVGTQGPHAGNAPADKGIDAAKHGVPTRRSAEVDRRKEPHMPGSKHGPSIKDPEQYEALRDEGMSKEKAARISNQSAKEGRSEVGERGGEAHDYEDRTKDELLERARALDLDVTTRMTKDELIEELRSH